MQVRDEDAGYRSRTVHIFHHSLRRGGGKERYAIALAEALRGLGQEVVFHAMKADAELAGSLGVRLNRVPVPAFPRKLQDLRFARAIDRLRPTLKGPQITLSRVCATDVLVSGGTHRGYLRHARKFAGPFDYLQIWLERRAYDSVKTIVAHADLLRNDLLEFYAIPATKIVTLYAPVDDRFLPPRFSAGREQLREQFGWPKDKVVFLFPSSGHSRKGLRAVAEAMGRFATEAVLAIAGKAPAPAHWPFVQFLGYVENMADAYFAADYTILGSYYEPFGLVGPESLVCGTRLVFEERIGCLSAVNPEFVQTFTVWDRNSIEAAIAAALALAKQQGHRLTAEQQKHALKYDPAARSHAEALLELVCGER